MHFLSHSCVYNEIDDGILRITCAVSSTVSYLFGGFLFINNWKHHIRVVIKIHIHIRRNCTQYLHQINSNVGLNYSKQMYTVKIAFSVRVEVLTEYQRVERYLKMTAKLYSMAWIIVCWSEVRDRNGTWFHVINGRLFILIPWSFTHTPNPHGWSVHCLFVNMNCFFNESNRPVNRYWLQSNAANFIRHVFYFYVFDPNPFETWFFYQCFCIRLKYFEILKRHKLRKKENQKQT